MATFSILAGKSGGGAVGGCIAPGQVRPLRPARAKVVSCAAILRVVRWLHFTPVMGSPAVSCCISSSIREMTSGVFFTHWCRSAFPQKKHRNARRPPGSGMGAAAPAPGTAEDRREACSTFLVCAPLFCEGLRAKSPLSRAGLWCAIFERCAGAGGTVENPTYVRLILAKSRAEARLQLKRGAPLRVLITFDGPKAHRDSFNRPPHRSRRGALARRMYRHQRQAGRPVPLSQFLA